MRFEYYPPTTKFRAFHLRRLLITYLVLAGLGCLAFATITHTLNNNKEKHPEALNLAQKEETSTTAKESESTNNKILAEQPINNGVIASLVPKKETWQTITVQVGDTIGNLFDRLGISQLTLKNFMSTSMTMDELSKIYPGQKLDFLFDDRKELKAVKFNLTNNKTLNVTYDGNRFKYAYEEAATVKRLGFSSGTISGSLYSSARAAGVNQKLIKQMADILSYDIDFSLDIRENDSFKILYEEEYLENRKVNPGKILAVEFNTKGKSYKAVHYQDKSGRGGYYSPDGYSLQKAFLRNPVQFTRISSHFATARHHPILHKIRMHKGVDYAAPTGTPVKAAGDGRITFIGNKNGYGKCIEVTHGKKYSTFYAHLSNFRNKLRLGSTVKQGQIIGYVGKSGLATGPHLHYEFRINGVHHNPVTVTLPRSQSISNKDKSNFSLHAKNMLTLLDNHSNLVQHD